MKRKTIVYDRKTGKIGNYRLSNKKEEEQFHTNYVVDILDPIYMTYIETVAGFGDGNYDWHSLDYKDTRYQFFNLFSILEDGDTDWEIDVNSGDCRHEIEGQEVNNRHDVFRWIKGLFT